MKKTLFILIAIFATTSSFSQKKYSFTPKDTLSMESEVFDYNLIKDKCDMFGQFDFTFYKEDSTEVHVFGTTDSYYVIYEYPPIPCFHNIYKEFNGKGLLVKKGIFMGSGCKIEKWMECDENGENCRIVDYEKNRGKFGYNDVLKFLDKKKFINLKTGDRREALTMTYRYEQQTWSISVSDDSTNIFRTSYILDGNTGKILEEKKYAIP